MLTNRSSNSNMVMLYFIYKYFWSKTVRSFLITLKSLPRYTFLQNIYNSKWLFCIFWDIKTSYIKTVIYCSLIVRYTKIFYELTSFKKRITTCRWMCVCKLYKHASVLICHWFHSHLYSSYMRKWNGPWTVAYLCSRQECLNVVMSRLNLG